jgi:hypothetical protein
MVDHHDVVIEGPPAHTGIMKKQLDLTWSTPESYAAYHMVYGVCGMSA